MTANRTPPPPGEAGRPGAALDERTVHALAEPLWDALVSTDPTFRVSAWSAGAEALFGWRAEDVLGLSAHDVLETAPVGASRAEMLGALAATGAWRGEALLQRSDGARLSVLLAAMALRDEAGRLTGYVTACRDLSEPRGHARALARLSLDLAGHGPDLAARTLAERVCEALGDACLVLLPGASGDLSVAAAHGPDAEFAARAGALATEADVRAGSPAVVHLADEQGAPLATLALAPLRAVDGDVGVLVAARPPAERAFDDVEIEALAGFAAQAAPALLAARRHAERDAAHRTLVARARELEVLVEELESFAYAVAHDLRKPLRAIDGFTEAVLQDQAERLDERAVDHLRRVRDNAERMTLLVEDLLVLARVTRREMRREPVDLSALAREVARDLPDPRSARAVDLAVEDGLSIDGDPGLLRIVLSNLLGNAWKFTARTPDARIEVGRAEGAPGEPVFFVRDNGAGFDMAQAAHLFEPFRRLHRQDDFPGTGVGLATCQRIIRRHGGRIWADGAVGRGATFFFSLPA